jgi:hypothetical protein
MKRHRHGNNDIFVFYLSAYTKLVQKKLARDASEFLASLYVANESELFQNWLNSLSNLKDFHSQLGEREFRNA